MKSVTEFVVEGRGHAIHDDELELVKLVELDDEASELEALLESEVLEEAEPEPEPEPAPGFGFVASGGALVAT